MVKFKVSVKFDKNLLNILKDNRNSGVQLKRIHHHLSLHPIHLNDFYKSTTDILNLGVAKYNKNLDGILLGYQNIKLPKDIGLINYDSCYVHIDLQAEFFVFKPEIGKEMRGIVNRKSKDHVGILVYDTFNVSIPKLQVDEEWLGNSVNIGSEVLFRITCINFSTYLPYIKGELVSILAKNDDICLKSKNISKKKLTKSIDKRLALSDVTVNLKKRKLKKQNEAKSEAHKNKKSKYDNEENSGEQHISDLCLSKNKETKFENKLEKEESMSHKKYTKLKKERDEAEGSLDLHLTELYKDSSTLSNQQNFYNIPIIENIKSEISSDSDILNMKLNKSERSGNLYKTYSSNTEDNNTSTKQKKLRKKKEVKKEQENEVSFSNLNLTGLFDTSKLEIDIFTRKNTSDIDLHNTHEILNDKKSKKRKHSVNETAFI